MNTFVVDRDSVTVPSWVVDLESFRRWARSEEFPDAGRICFLGGEVWVDMSKEQIFTHNQVKAEFTVVLGGLVKAVKLGRYYPDGILLTNADANLTCQPDGTFVSRESLKTERVRLVEGAEEGFVELEGSPDMVLEIVSAASVKKDNTTLFDLYWHAEVEEYWLVDVRGERLRFEIYRHTARGYVASRKQAGWLRSAVFGKSFRLRRTTGDDGNPEYRLELA